MRNRYGDVYDFVREGDNTYRIAGDLKYWRFGGKEGQQELDMNDLGMCDPSGGPYLAVGMDIKGRKIVRIRASGDLDGSPRVLLDVE